MNNVAIIFLAIASIITTVSLTQKADKGDAMKVCQLSHSHDVCFQTLNR